MLTDDLYRKVLIIPAVMGANTLYVVSGYASAGMADQHIRDVHENFNGAKIRVNLVVGMTAQEGIQKRTHLGFMSLAEGKTLKDVGEFSCSYLMESPSNHAKVYAWFKDDQPVAGFIGSANYTQRGFIGDQLEVMSTEDPAIIRDYYRRAEEKACFCTHQDVQGIVKDEDLSTHVDTRAMLPVPEEKMSLNLLDRQGDLPARSGLNWGQRPEAKREPNQAYIRVSKKVQESGFFPDRGIHFTLHTDDGQVIICARRQDEGKAIHSTENNSAIGEYFRRRLGVKLGQLVTKADLERYGRFDAVFHKIDDDNYYMDFSSSRQG